MKKLTLIILVVVMGFAGCRKDDAALFEKSADERLNEALANYQTQLSGASNGWKALLYPAGGGVYSFYFKFNDNNRVQMLSDFTQPLQLHFAKAAIV